MAKGRFKVILTTTSEHEYDIEDVNSPEEAISVAEMLLEEGETGNITMQDEVAWDAYPEDETHADGYSGE